MLLLLVRSVMVSSKYLVPYGFKVPYTLHVAPDAVRPGRVHPGRGRAQRPLRTYSDAVWQHHGTASF